MQSEKNIRKTKHSFDFSCIKWSQIFLGPVLGPSITPSRGGYCLKIVCSDKSLESLYMATKKTLLTEQELLAMPEDDYMDDRQLAFFRNRLVEMEAELRINADQTTEHLRETVVVSDAADRATIEEEHALELRTRDRERKLLKKVQSAIQRIDSGDYGWCEETGEPIGVARLLARPTATLCLDAQLRREIRQKMYGN